MQYPHVIETARAGLAAPTRQTQRQLVEQSLRLKPARPARAFIERDLRRGPVR